MEAYKEHGGSSNGTSDKVRFSQLLKGDVFKHSGRVLIKTSWVKVADRNDYQKILTFNALRLTMQPGSKSKISLSTFVEPFPDAAIYLKG